MSRPGAPMSQFIERDGVRIHHVRYDGPEPPLVLIHGLSANLHYFDSLVRAGLPGTRGVLALDLRGRGLSDKPATGYSVAAHAADVIALLDHHGIERTVICGHSYGGLVAVYLASEYPDRVSRAIVIDIAGPSIRNPEVFELLKPSLDRLGKVFPSLDEFLATRKQQSYLTVPWDDAIESFFRADVEDLPDGRVRVRIPPEVIEQVIAEGREIDWQERFTRVRQQALLLHATGPYGPPGTPALVLESQAREAAALLPRCRYAWVPGNHMTMLLGENVHTALAEIRAFLAE
jgi:pimeloyl-ACP methyl ester carboxylesterase